MVIPHYLSKGQPMNGLGCPFQVPGSHRDLVALLEAEVDGSVGQAAAVGLDRRGGRLAVEVATDSGRVVLGQIDLRLELQHSLVFKNGVYRGSSRAYELSYFSRALLYLRQGAM